MSTALLWHTVYCVSDSMTAYHVVDVCTCVQRKGTLRSWIKDNKAKDPNWVEPWNKKDETAQQVTAFATVIFLTLNILRLCL
jgi:hypothetical protein